MFWEGVHGRASAAGGGSHCVGRVPRLKASGVLPQSTATGVPHTKVGSPRGRHYLHIDASSVEMLELADD